MSWGNLLHVIAPEQRQQLLDAAAQVDAAPPTSPLTAEAAAVEATVAALQRAVPQNMFASFSLGVK